MSLPVQSVRAAPEHRDVLTAVAELLRQDKADQLRELLSRMGDAPVGPFRSESDAIGFLRDRLVATLRPEEIWLFGSRARGQSSPHSDFDLLVVLADGLPEENYEPQKVAAPVTACGLAVDVVPCRKGDFMKDKDDPSCLVGQAVREGRKIYVRRPKRQ
ncbi:putative DNA polymerase beta domain protein (Modular protein) [Rhodospirillaceae bacterium LM-1]|nr:putative DNA polymerase beta domain protein (Modular protein) [Rhodospirillaceae bacterium LM-1]